MTATAPNNPSAMFSTTTPPRMVKAPKAQATITSNQRLMDRRGGATGVVSASPIKYEHEPYVICVRACSNARSIVRRRSLLAMRPDEVDRRLRERLNALGPAPRAELLHVLMLPDFDRADAIGSY